MCCNDDVVLLIKYLNAEVESWKEYYMDQRFHVDLCNCDRCQIVQQWFALPWYRRLAAKFAL